MELSPFVKFKNLLRELRKEEEIQQKDILEHCDILQQVLDNGGEYSTFKPLFVTKDATIVKQTAVVKDEKNAKRTVEESKIYLKTSKKRCAEEQSLINAMDNERVTGYIVNLDFLLNALQMAMYEEALSVSEAMIIFGSAVYNNNKFAKQNNDERNKEAVKRLAQYFNCYGKFVYVKEPGAIVDAFGQFLALCRDLIEFENSSRDEAIDRNYNYDTVQFCSDIVNAYFDFWNDFERPLERNDSEKKEVTYTNHLKEYYRNGVLIKVPDNLDEFVLLLKEENIPDNEQRHILELVRIAMEKQRKALLSCFYIADDEVVIKTAQEVLDNASNKGGNYYEIKELLEDIQSMESMYIEATSEEDKDYILEEKQTYIARLRDLVVPKEEIEPINIAFLRDSAGDSYFHKDLETIDKGLRKRVSSLLAKINNDSKRYFRKVFPTEEISFEIYEVVNPDLHIIFTEIPGNVFMIIGIATTGNGYREISNRLVNKENQKNILEIAEAIKDDEVKKKYLTEQNAMIPQTSEKRVRK